MKTSIWWKGKWCKKIETTTYDLTKAEYDKAFKRYRQAHHNMMANDCRWSRRQLREAIDELNNTAFVKNRTL